MSTLSLTSHLGPKCWLRAVSQKPRLILRWRAALRAAAWAKFLLLAIAQRLDRILTLYIFQLCKRSRREAGYKEIARGFELIIQKLRNILNEDQRNLSSNFNLLG